MKDFHRICRCSYLNEQGGLWPRAQQWQQLAVSAPLSRLHKQRAICQATNSVDPRPRFVGTQLTSTLRERPMASPPPLFLAPKPVSLSTARPRSIRSLLFGWQLQIWRKRIGGIPSSSDTTGPWRGRSASAYSGPAERPAGRLRRSWVVTAR